MVAAVTLVTDATTINGEAVNKPIPIYAVASMAITNGGTGNQIQFTFVGGQKEFWTFANNAAAAAQLAALEAAYLGTQAF